MRCTLADLAERNGWRLRHNNHPYWKKKAARPAKKAKKVIKLANLAEYVEARQSLGLAT